MKCKVCGGTGTSNTCVNGTFKPCSFCDGTGECDANEVDRFSAVDVIKVMEMVKKRQTNFEWLTETPERLASWIEYVLIESGCEVTQCRETWIMWLKQPHRDKE